MCVFLPPSSDSLLLHYEEKKGFVGTAKLTGWVPICGQPPEIYCSGSFLSAPPTLSGKWTLQRCASSICIENLFFRERANPSSTKDVSVLRCVCLLLMCPFFPSFLSAHTNFLLPRNRLHPIWAYLAPILALMPLLLYSFFFLLFARPTDRPKKLLWAFLGLKGVDRNTFVASKGTETHRVASLLANGLSFTIEREKGFL